MAGGEQVRITQAKGRPMLSWVGKRPLREVRAFPAQLVERYAPDAPAGVTADVDWSGWPDRYDRGGLLFHGDNKEVLAHLLANGFRGKVDLVYIDPPFDSGADYVRRVQLRGGSGTARIDGENYTLGEQIQYTDIWANDTYLQFMYERLLLLKELLADTGSVFLHCDWHKQHVLRCLLDEIFGADAFRNEVVVKRGRRKNLQSQFDRIDALGAETDSILIYTRTDRSGFAKVLSDIRATESKWKDFWRGNVDRPTMRYAIPQLGYPEPNTGQLLWRKERGLQAASNYREFLNSGEPDIEEYWRSSRDQYQEASGSPLEFVAWDGKHIIKYWIPPKEMGVIGSLWADIEAYSYKHDFPTEKHESLLKRIIEMATDDGDLVLDCFIGSGTTAAVAQKLGRRWIGADINKGAIQTTEKRLAGIIADQVATGAGEQLTLADDAPDGPPRPAQLGFAVYRVNDYDLQIQHNEAVELAVAHLGVARTRTDTFFHGTLGRELVYIVAFDHPATPLDLQAVEAELRARPGTDADVVVVALGRELSTQAWLDTWNRHRPVNRIRLIDLRTDPKHGRFLEHRPATARVCFERVAGTVRVTIEDVISPSILERLAGQEGILQPRVDDWRAMVDTVAIDPSYDGETFEVGVLDVPERKRDLVAGTYDVSVDAGSADPVAVRITDMLGEEILILESR